jgi:CheY-like chemotaxis protein
LEDARNRAEQELQQSHKQLEAERSRLAYLFTHAPSFVATVRGENHVFEMANPPYLQLIGHREVIGKPVRDALPEIEGQGFFELLDNVYQTGKPFIGRELPVEIQRQPGSGLEKRFVDFVYQPIFDADNRVSDVIISDIGMPEEDGFSLIGKIRDLPDEEGGNVPAIALTAYARAEDRVRAIRSGFQMHIAKPVEPAELIAVVANLGGRMRNPNGNVNV